MKPIGRRAHGFVDYATAATQLALAPTLPAKPATKVLLGISGASAALLGALTDYELGLVRVVPMRIHLAIDAVFAATLASAAALLDESPAVRGLLAAYGGTATASATLTDLDNP